MNSLISVEETRIDDELLVELILKPNKIYKKLPPFRNEQHLIGDGVLRST